MGRRYPKELIDQIKRDRFVGLSIPDLVDKYEMPKTTVWHHVHAIKLSDALQASLSSRKGGSHQRKIRRENEAEKFAMKLLLSSRRELVIAATMLYWAEGHKKSFVFTNTDPQMLRLFMNFITTVLDVDESRCTVLIRTSDSIIPARAIQYWSKILELPDSAFKVNHDNIQNRTKTEFGICRIVVTKSEFLHKIVLSLVRQLQSNFMPL
jgi:hypothetical protein